MVVKLGLVRNVLLLFLSYVNLECRNLICFDFARRVPIYPQFSDYPRLTVYLISILYRIELRQVWLRSEYPVGFPDRVLPFTIRDHSFIT